MHDFKFYQLTIKHARWIGGFGQIAWLDQKKKNGATLAPNGTIMNAEL